MRNRIFVPLGMTRSNSSIKDPKELREVATPYSEKENGEVVSVPWDDTRTVGPSASIVSTIEDMSKWVQVHLRVSGHNLIQNETLDEIHTIQITMQSIPEAETGVLGYGLGWAIGFLKGRYTIAHDGSISGFGSHVVFFPEEKIGHYSDEFRQSQ